ncbi:phosphofurin acidic cluster sorting protein 2 isoform X2 [Contarinia nasturtii]|uniref:phosphofurin acidic cluster sorting protein 2 isoform X2 n=1 Tax=Contarinia nasturtii TaxID=265458 RepID=UPI0012D48036|nr:phosphofurin acidic cluster sorting protein 2 isoform X2 [Contarinia nasturtii]
MSKVLAEKPTRLERLANMNKPVPMKLFAAWEVDRTPSDCIPRLCSLSITRLTLMMPLPSDLTSLSLAVKMQSSKRTLRSHEIPVPQTFLTGSNSVGFGSSMTGSAPPSLAACNVNNTSFGSIGGSGTSSFFETDLDLHFSLQYPHFIKRDGNRLQILLQRRKKYKSRTILGYKTLAEGIIRMDAVLQKSMDMTVELTASGKSGRQGCTVATLRADRVSSIPVDHDNKNNNSVVLADRVNEFSDEDEEIEFSSGEYDPNNGSGNGPGVSADHLTGYDAKRGYAMKRDLRKYRKIDQVENDGEVDDGALGANPADSDSEFENIKVKGTSRAKISHQRNFKQKIIALLKRFKVPDELEGGGSRGPGALRGERELDALFQELDSLSCCEGDDSGPDMDSLSVGSTPKPSLRPFFTNSKNMLHENLMEKGDWKNDSSGNEGAAGTDLEGQNSDPSQQQSANATNSPPREKETITERRNKLFRATSNTPNSKKKQSLSLTADQQATTLKSVLESCLSPTNVEPRKSLLDQLTRTFSTEEAVLPDVLSIFGPPESHSTVIMQRLAPLLSASLRPTFSPQNTAEVRAVLQALMNKIHKYCNSTAKPPTTIKVLLVGGDWLQGAVLRHYVDLLGVRPPDWVNHIRFYIVPLCSSSISRYLSAIDSSYASMFGNDSWTQLCESAASIDPVQAKPEIQEILNRIQRYLHTAGPCTQIPIAEAMVNYKDEDSCQIFVPFVCDVKLGSIEPHQLSVDLDESLISGLLQQSQQTSGNSLLSGSSPPHSGRTSPPVTPSSVQVLHHQQSLQQIVMPQVQQQQQQSQTFQLQSQQEPMELQLEYWLIKTTIDKDKILAKGFDQGKCSIKGTFRNLQVCRLPLNPQSGEISQGLVVNYATKEKKQKIMRLGKKKEKDRDQEKEQFVDGVSRLICSPNPKQSHPIPLRVYIDGTEWTGVKFFQLSSQWQTHVKNFPVGLIGAQLTPSDLS